MIWNCIPVKLRKLMKSNVNSKIRSLFLLILEAEDDYVDVTTIIVLMAKQ